MGKGFNSRLDFRQPHKVHVPILLLVMFLIAFGQGKGFQRIVIGGLTFEDWVFFVSGAQ